MSYINHMSDSLIFVSFMDKLRDLLKDYMIKIDEGETMEDIPEIVFDCRRCQPENYIYRLGEEFSYLELVTKLTEHTASYHRAI